MKETTEEAIEKFIKQWCPEIGGKKLMKSELEYLVILAKIEQLKEN